MQWQHTVTPEQAGQRETVLQPQRARDFIRRSDRPLGETHGFHDGAGLERQSWPERTDRVERLREHMTSSLMMPSHFETGNQLLKVF